MDTIFEDSKKTLFRRSWILVGSFLSLCFLGILNSAYSTVLVLIKGELALSYTLSGALMSSYYVGYTTGQIPWGYLADKFGSRKVITLSVIGIASSTILFGLAVNVWQAIASRFLSGLLGAGVFVPSVRLISGWFSKSERGTALGIIGVGSSIGLIIASWTTPLLSLIIGWRRSMILFGFSCILTSTLIWRSLRDRKRKIQSLKSNENLTKIFKSKSFWILSLTQFLRLGSNYTFITWLPLLLQEEYGLSLLSAGTAFSIYNLAALVSNPAGGFVSDRIGTKRVLLFSFFTLSFSVLLFASVKKVLMVYPLAFILGWFIHFVRSPSFAILPKLYGVNTAGKISGIHNTFASLGAFSLPFFLGYIRDLTASYYPGWMTLSALFLFGAFINLFLRTKP